MVVIPSFEGGGAERILTRILKNFYTEFKFVVVTFYNSGRYLSEVKSIPGITYFCLNAESGNTFSFVFRLRKIIREERPFKILSFLYYPNIVTFLSLIFINIPFILSERSNHRQYLTSSFKHRVWKFLLGKAYRKASYVITVSEKSRKFIIDDFKVHGEKIIPIPNGISFSLLDELKNEKITEFNFNKDMIYILAVGNLSKAKNYPLLLESFNILLNRRKNINLIILGKGEMEAELKKQAESLEISDFVNFLGYVDNPYKFMAASTCYVLSSKWEGFPNSLIEAMYVNGHVVSTNCPTGPSEIITDGVDGILCEPDNPHQLARAIERMCFDNEFRSFVFANSRRKIINFSENKMIEKYRELLLK